ncbi:XrtA-associated tyrosine autokinase [Geoalkalibacter halelectricus]|uniref:non-specific protein-tyrosine kinase n=1 Tax=Geoalkalibacter halelectricus TaxID=2847045 RepID=A0ABY5ZLV2_9BACT|nr:XrtA-associated tyrosine autokinase [Geoalkalibacter halelectricus]MDO3379699.1 XrtA-associated tyrosine autokinase [Geoalkalibacter halelectricus]UWZ79598.1 XrtA-associated tyrosine autokinase [Geoalkalibacter halelectricus]
MSRIEKALERAAQKRAAEGATPQVPSPPAMTPAATASSAVLSDYAAFEQVPHPAVANPCLVTATDPNSPISEQYRKLKSLLIKMTRSEQSRNSLLVTSTVGGEGKTITALNLAITLAQEYDHTVLLIEADLRRPTIMNYLGLHASVGLADCVLDGVDVGEALVKTGIGKLSVLPAGRAVKDPVEVFSSARMAKLLQEVKTRYSDRFVILDSTPLLPFAEGQILAHLVDSVIFVARQEYTPFDKLKDALASLKSANLLGVVCNDIDGGITGTGYYGYYGYYKYPRKSA